VTALLFSQGLYRPCDRERRLALEKGRDVLSALPQGEEILREAYRAFEVKLGGDVAGHGGALAVSGSGLRAALVERWLSLRRCFEVIGRTVLAPWMASIETKPHEDLMELPRRWIGNRSWMHRMLETMGRWTHASPSHRRETRLGMAAVMGIYFSLPEAVVRNPGRRDADLARDLAWVAQVMAELGVDLPSMSEGTIEAWQHYRDGVCREVETCLFDGSKG
jgi:hypothetical protein